MTKIDLGTQTQGVLSRLHGGTQNTQGYGNEQLVATFVNDSGATLDLGTVVTRSAANPQLHPADAAGETVVGVVVGRLNSSTGLVQASAPTAGQSAVVCLAGRCDVLTETAADRGDYLSASTTDGQAAVTSSPVAGSFGYVLFQNSSTSAQALIGSGASTSGVSDHGALTGLADDDHTSYVTVIGGGGETLSTIAATGSTETVNLASGNVHDLTLTADCTLTLTGATVGVACSLTLLLRQDGTGNRHATWPGSVVWPGAVTPTLATAAAAVDVFTLFTLDGGSVWFGFQAGTGSSSIDTLNELTDVTISSPVEGSRLRYNGSVWVNSMSFPEILIVDSGASTPLIFADLVQNDDQTDLLYADP